MHNNVEIHGNTCNYMVRWRKLSKHKKKNEFVHHTNVMFVNNSKASSCITYALLPSHHHHQGNKTDE